MTAPSASLARRSSWAALRASCRRSSNRCAIRLKASARVPTSSCVCTMLRCSNFPAASAWESFQSWRRGLTIRPDSVHAIADVSSSVASANSAPQVKRRSTGANAISVGRPTDTSQGTSFAVDEPVMRSTPSGHTVNSPASLAARCRATSALLLRSRLIQLLSLLRATTMPCSLTTCTAVPAGSRPISNAFRMCSSTMPTASTARRRPSLSCTGRASVTTHSLLVRARITSLIDRRCPARIWRKKARSPTNERPASEEVPMLVPSGENSRRLAMNAGSSGLSWCSNASLAAVSAGSQDTARLRPVSRLSRLPMWSSTSAAVRRASSIARCTAAAWSCCH